jgi:hypothetical protein
LKMLTGTRRQGSQSPRRQGFQSHRRQGFQGPRRQGSQSPRRQGSQRPRRQGFQGPRRPQCPRRQGPSCLHKFTSIICTVGNGLILSLFSEFRRTYKVQELNEYERIGIEFYDIIL